MDTTFDRKTLLVLHEMHSNTENDCPCGGNCFCGVADD